MARRSRIEGDFKLRKTLRNIHATMDNELRVAMQEAADLVLASQQELIPRDTGEAASALTAFVSKSGLDAQIGIRGKKNNKDLYYMRFVEHGTKGYSGDKRAGNRKRRDTNKSNGGTFFGKYPDIPARAAHPWLRPSYDMNKEDIVRIIEGAISSTLARAAGDLGNG